MRELSKKNWVAGVDEAGRGPLAGPVIAAAVILDPRRPIKGLADSKKLSEQIRNKLFQEIRQKALAFAFARGTVAEIESINILQASLLAMQRAVARLKIIPFRVLVDGNFCPQFACEARAIIQGDAIEPAISAASIVAKVIRDRLMVMLDKKYPDYGFAKHKGYATPQHLETLQRLGPTRIHRRTFAPVRESLDTFTNHQCIFVK